MNRLKCGVKVVVQVELVCSDLTVMQTIDIAKHFGDFCQMIHTFMLNVGVLLYVT